MAGWIAQVDNSVASSGPVVSTDNLRRTMGGGSAHIQADTEAQAKTLGAAALGVQPYQVTVTPYSNNIWNEVKGQ